MKILYHKRKMQQKSDFPLIFCFYDYLIPCLFNVMLIFLSPLEF